MAGFKTHITTSTALGVAYGSASLLKFDVPLPACLLAGGLCSVSGMLPDLDSDSGVPLRESVAFAAAVVPLLMIERLKRLGMPPEYMVLAGAGIYLFIRFGLAKVLARFTVHRGMFHSLPACAIAGELAFLICGHENMWERYFNASAVMIGFMSHLVLDEIWSLDFRHFKIKKSFGTAMKFWGESISANLITYAGLVLLTLMAAQDPTIMDMLAPSEGQSEQMATQPASFFRH